METNTLMFIGNLYQLLTNPILSVFDDITNNPFLKNSDFELFESLDVDGFNKIQELVGVDKMTLLHRRSYGMVENGFVEILDKIFIDEDDDFELSIISYSRNNIIVNANFVSLTKLDSENLIIKQHCYRCSVINAVVLAIAIKRFNVNDVFNALETYHVCDFEHTVAELGITNETTQ